MLGSAAIDLAWVATGIIDASIMLANRAWDTAAGVIIAREAGAQVVDIDGSRHSIKSRATIAGPPALVTHVLQLIHTAEPA